MSIIFNSGAFGKSHLSDKDSILSHCNQSRKFLPNRMWLFALVTTVLWLPSQAIAATSLDQALANLLDNQCANLTGGGAVAGIGPTLTDICTSVPVTAGGSVGGGTGTAQSLGATVENRRSERLEGKPTGKQGILNLPSGLGLFVSGNIENLDKDDTAFTDGFDSTVLGGTVGADFLLTDKFLAGAAFNFVNRNGDFDGGGDFNTDSFGFLTFVSFIPTPATFLDISLGYTKHNYEVDRDVEWVVDRANALTSTRFTGKTTSDSDGDEVFIRAVTGYDHNIGSLTVGPRIGFNYSQLTIDPYSEKSSGQGLALSYDEQSVRSLQGTVGVQGSMAINTSYGVWVPQATANFVHEFENDRRDITVQLVEDQRAAPTKFSFNNDKPDRNFFNFSFGTVLVLPKGIQPFFNLRVMAGNSQFDNYAGTVGVRIEGS